jgi:hypothetical protein
MSYNYRVKSPRTGNWEPWSGLFKNKKQARRWYDLHGSFHEQRGHRLTLFKEGEMIK